MQDPIVTLKFDGSSLKMPFPGGDVSLYFDGTIDTKGIVNADHILALFAALEPPKNGRVWWKIFLANMVFQTSETDYDRLAECFRFGNNEKAITRNTAIVNWLRDSGLFKAVNVTVFYHVRSHLWDKDSQEPRRDRTSALLYQYIQDNPFPTRRALNDVLKNQSKLPALIK